jgi:acetylornithine/N-succinyldiaminopimelate aminotransferase
LKSILSMHQNRQLFLSHIAQTSSAPMLLEFDRAEGVYLYSPCSRAYIDLISGFAVSNIGHGNKLVLEAIRNQIGKYMHLMVYGEVIQSPQIQYASKLAAHLPNTLDSVYFTNSGAEATEGAMKLAKRLTGRSKFIHFKNSYHGSTQGALSVMGDEYFKSSFRPLLPDIYELLYNDIDGLAAVDCRTAAVIIEPIQAESGVTVPDVKFMKLLRKKCDESGVLLIADEAQTGFGRTGKLWAFEHFEIVPDVLLLAKAIGGGLPLGAFISSGKNMQALTENPVLGHITTFGGHPVSCAAGLAAFEFLLKEIALQEVEKKGARFEAILSHEQIKTFRRKGLMMAIQFHSEESNKKVIHQCIKNGLVTDWFLFATDCLRICPPLTILESEIEFCCKLILQSIDEVFVS